MSSLNTASSPARYLIAQYMADPLRREPVNVGVVVEKDGHVTARFRGENDEGAWDKRKVPSMPNAYRLWVDHWRKEMTAFAGDWPQSPRRSTSANFSLVPGGVLTNIGADSPQAVCAYLYSLLVSQGGFAEATSEDSDSDSSVALRSDVADSFRRLNILGSLLARNPILSDYQVAGTTRFHPVAFFQQVGHQAWPMETIDFDTRYKLGARDHAAYARYVFSDLNEKSRMNGTQFNNVAIIRLRWGEDQNEHVSAGLEMIGGLCRIVNWLDSTQRNEFIREREMCAQAV